MPISEESTKSAAATRGSPCKILFSMLIFSYPYPCIPQTCPRYCKSAILRSVSIARALAKNPKLLLCDEPTGALDYSTGKQILKLLQDTCREKGMTVIVITHNSAIAPMADRVIRIKNGKVSESVKNEAPADVMSIEW